MKYCCKDMKDYFETMILGHDKNENKEKIYEELISELNFNCPFCSKKLK